MNTLCENDINSTSEDYFTPNDTIGNGSSSLDSTLPMINTTDYKLTRIQELNQHNLEKLWRVAPFLNSKLGTVIQPFKGSWKTEDRPQFVRYYFRCFFSYQAALLVTMAMQQ